MFAFRWGTAPPPSSNSWIVFIIGLYIALNRTHNIDCYCVRAVLKVYLIGFRVLGVGFRGLGLMARYCGA